MFTKSMRLNRSLETIGTKIIIALIAMPNTVIINSLTLGTRITSIRVVVILWFHFLIITKKLHTGQLSLSVDVFGCRYGITNTERMRIAYSSELLGRCRLNNGRLFGRRSGPASLHGLGTAFIYRIKILVFYTNKSMQMKIVKIIKNSILNWSFLVICKCVFKFFAKVIPPNRIYDFLWLLLRSMSAWNFKIMLVLTTVQLLLFTRDFSIWILRRLLNGWISKGDLPLMALNFRSVHCSQEGLVIIVHFWWKRFMRSIRTETAVLLPLKLELLHDFIVFLLKLSDFPVFVRNNVFHFRNSLYQSVILIMSTLQLLE